MPAKSPSKAGSRGVANCAARSRLNFEVGISTAGVEDRHEQLDALVSKYWPDVVSEPAKKAGSDVVPQAVFSGNSLDVQERARRYLARMPGAVSGSGGDPATFHAACILVLGFNLRPEDAIGPLSEWNQSCVPLWSEGDLWYKLTSADKKEEQRGWLLQPGGRYDGSDVDLRNLLASCENATGDQSAEPVQHRHCLNLLDLPPDTDDGWPAPLEAPAFHGVAGDFVSEVLPETEADAAALLFHFLTFAGAMFGRERYYPVGGTSHHARLFSVVVGGTSSGRKGTALDCVSHIFRMVDASLNTDAVDVGNLASISISDGFCENNVVNGLVSGSGLIWQVRDPQERGAKLDGGVDDKRLLVVESEFGGVLKVCQRRENDLSAVIRDAWDGKTLRRLAKQEPAKATAPHVGIAGHITCEELRGTLAKLDIANGLAN